MELHRHRSSDRLVAFLSISCMSTDSTVSSSSDGLLSLKMSHRNNLTSLRILRGIPGVLYTPQQYFRCPIYSTAVFQVSNILYSSISDVLYILQQYSRSSMYTTAEFQVFHVHYSRIPGIPCTLQYNSRCSMYTTV